MRLLHVHRQTIAIASILLVSACGGGGDAPPTTVTPPPPPPPTPAVPASLSVSAGDGQIAEPNSLVPTTPAVLVRSASGAGVPNISVAFLVDSGGGSVGTSTATTDANGIASVGSWRLGGTEGPQVIIASVASLTPVRIRATVRIEPKTIGSGTLSPQGGTITVSQAGSPLNGLSIELPAGAVGTNATLSMSIASTVGMSMRPGLTATSAALNLTTSIGQLKQPAIIRFPIPKGTGQRTFIAIRNPTTGDLTILPPLGKDSVSVSALMYAMDASPIPSAPGSLLLRLAGASRENGVGIFTVQIDSAVTAKPYDSQFRVRKDNWDFEAVPIAWLPFLPGTAEGNQQEEVLDASAGMIATALWYFENRRADGPLYNRFRLQPDQAYSNKMGFRWSALANRDLWDPGATFSKSWEEWITDDPGVYAKTQLDGLKVLFYLERERPIPVLLFDKSAVDTTAKSVAVGIATRVDGDEIHVVVANNSESEYVIKVLPTGIRPFTVFDRRGSEAFSVNGFAPILNRLLTDAPGVGSNWGRVVSGTLGDSEGWPTPTLHYEKGELDTTNVFIGDTLTFWWQCARCPDYGLRAQNLPNATHLQAFLYGRKTNGAIAPFSTEVIRGSARWKPDSVTSDLAATETGHAVFLAQTVPGEPNKVIPGWLDWKVVKFKKTSLRPNPATLEISQDTTVTWTLSPTTALPAGTRYSWVLRTEDGRDSAETTTATHPRNLKVDKPGTLLITAYEAASKRVLARDSVDIKSGEPVPYWKLTTFVDVDDLVDPPGTDAGQGGPLFDLLWGAKSVPKSALITTTGNQLSMRVKRAGVWADCCPPPFGNDDHVWIWPTWSQSTTNLGSGTITGVRTEGSSSFRVDATRNGKVMTGTMLLTVNQGVDSQGRPDISTYRFTFTAERMR